MVFLSAGHNSKSKTIKQDPGAVGNGFKEGDLTIEFRDLVANELDNLGVKYIKDSDEESLSSYLNRIQPGNASVVIEYHFDAATPLATGTTAVSQSNADRLDLAFCKELVDSTAKTLGIKNRGVISEAQTHHGRLGLMREQGIVCLVELCFISNATDIISYHQSKNQLAKLHAAIIKKYEAMIP